MIYSKMYIGGSEVIETEGYNISKSISENNSSSSFDLEVNNPYGRNSDKYQIGQEVKVYAEMGSLIYTPGSPMNYETFNWSTIPSGGISNLYMQFKFNESGTSTVDSEYGIVGSKVGTNFKWDNGKVGSAISLDGATGVYIYNTSGAFLSGNYFSFGGWVKPFIIGSEASHNLALFGRNQLYAIMAYNNGSVVYGCRSGATSSQAYAGSISAGNWNHLFMTYDGTAKRAYGYNNGSYMGSMAIANIGSSPMTSAPFAVGYAVLNGDPLYFSGLVDDFRIYNQCLGSDIIRQMYNSGLGDEVSIYSGSDVHISGTNLYNLSSYGTSGLMNSVKFVEGKLGNCYDFDGQTSFVNIETTPNIPSYSYGATATEPRSIWFSPV